MVQVCLALVWRGLVGLSRGQEAASIAATRLAKLLVQWCVTMLS